MKGRLWCECLPIVRVAQGETPKPFTLIVPFYMNHDFLRYQLAHWSTFPADLLAQMSVIVVDDGSPVPAVVDVTALPFSLRLFRIEEDRRWNWLAARNIGATHAAEGWLLFTDMDHVLPVPTAHAVIYGRHQPGHVYAFSRTEHTGADATPHSASFLMTRETFWKTGGYDETLSGYYGTDGDFRRRLSQVAQILVLTDALVRHEYQGDSSTTHYLRKQAEDARVRQLVAARRPGWRPKTLSFPYHEVTA